jgi:hypothetical protein
VKATSYRLYFITEDGNRISNENIYVADNREANAQKRIFRMRFTFKNQKYSKDKPLLSGRCGCEQRYGTVRHAVVMDLAFADDFGLWALSGDCSKDD